MKRNILAASILISLGFALPAHSLDLGTPLGDDESKISVGFQSSWSSYGLSGKYQYSDTVAVQGTLGLLGTVNNYSVRGLYTFNKEDKYSLYGFGGLGLWTWDSGVSYIDDESTVGFNLGAGAEYEVVPKVLVSAELGLGIVSFDEYSFSSMGIGVGAHYRF